MIEYYQPLSQSQSKFDLHWPLKRSISPLVERANLSACVSIAKVVQLFHETLRANSKVVGGRGQTAYKKIWTIHHTLPKNSNSPKLNFHLPDWCGSTSSQGKSKGYLRFERASSGNHSSHQAFPLVFLLVWK